MMPFPIRRVQERQRRSKAAAVKFLAAAVVVIHCCIGSLGGGLLTKTRVAADAFTFTCQYYSYKTTTTTRLPTRRKVISRFYSSFAPTLSQPNQSRCSSSRQCLTRRLLNRFLFDPSEVTATETSITSTDSGSGLPPPAVPTVTLPKDDYRTIHAAKILGLQNGDTIRAGIVSCTDTSTSTTSFCTKHGFLTDTATIQWIGPEGNKVKKADQPMLQNQNGSNPPPGSSLRIHLHSLQEPNHANNSSSSLIGVSLILALPRPLQLGRMLPMIAQMGVDHLVLMHATKVPRDYFGSHLFVKPQELTNRLVEGLCQAGVDVRLPTIHVIRPGRDYRNFWARNNDLNTMAASPSLLNRLFPKDEYARVVAHPQRVSVVEGTATTPPPLLLQQPPPRMRDVQFPQSSFRQQQQQQQRKLVLAVGPEGGWAEPDELDMLVDAGFQIITIGPRVLRSDCAVVSLLALAHDAVTAAMD